MPFFFLGRKGRWFGSAGVRLGGRERRFASFGFGGDGYVLACYLFAWRGCEREGIESVFGFERVCFLVRCLIVVCVVVLRRADFWILLVSSYMRGDGFVVG